ncbi:MAG: transcriptional repressor [Alphaproteobacteria bacterium]|nr:transcriptional repressor [Alphaproteobacteria bacterium]
MTERPFAQAINRLRDADLRPTRQRLALAKLLFEQGCDRHVTAEALHEEAQKVGARVSLATVYNTLHQFTDAGLLREIMVDSGKTYFDTNVGDHYHFLCEKSGQLIDIPAHLVTVADMPAAPDGRRISRVDIVIRLADE